MTINELGTERLIQLLRAEPGFERAKLAGPPQPLSGGFWASMSVLRLAGVAPPADKLVLRLMPDPALAVKETAIQREIVRQGFPAPAIRLSGGTDDGLGSAFMLMDLAPGVPVLAGLDGIAAVRHLPALARRLAVTLGQATAALHALDPAPLRHALAGPEMTAPSDPAAFLASLTTAADQLGDRVLSAAASWLAAHPPRPSRHVIAHGDLHPFNLLVDHQRWTLLDWTSALIADPAYDLAFTTLMLRHPPLTAPRWLRPAIAAAGAALARQFRSAYRRQGGTIPDQQALDWYTSLHALRILIELHHWRHSPARPDHPTHPWNTAGPVAAAILSQTTRTAVTPLT